MKRILMFAFGLAALLLMGCASAHQYVPIPDLSKQVEDPNKGRVYVLRPSGFGGAVGMNVADGGQPIGSTGPGRFLCWEREPGDVIITSTSENTSRVSIPVRPGSVHYILQNIRMGIWMARTDLEVIDTERGLKELKKCKAAEVKKQ